MTDRRGTSRRWSLSRKVRTANPIDSTPQKMAMPYHAPVLLNASAISMGMKIPKVGNPTTLRISEMISAPIGTSRRMRNVP